MLGKMPVLAAALQLISAGLNGYWFNWVSMN